VGGISLLQTHDQNDAFSRYFAVLVWNCMSRVFLEDIGSKLGTWKWQSKGQNLGKYFDWSESVIAFQGSS
jgi:hypothetical protein